jgi:hypothetical protein
VKKETLSEGSGSGGESTSAPSRLPCGWSARAFGPFAGFIAIPPERASGVYGVIERAGRPGALARDRRA